VAINELLGELENTHKCSGLCSYKPFSDNPFTENTTVVVKNRKVVLPPLYVKPQFSLFWLFSDVTEGPPPSTDPCRTSLESQITQDTFAPGVVFIICGALASFGWMAMMGMQFKKVKMEIENKGNVGDSKIKMIEF
jgi:hypothetical protein